MKWRPAILFPAILILLIHGLIWHEHGQHGLVIPSFQNSGNAEISLLESLLSADTGEEHLEAYHASKALEEISEDADQLPDHPLFIQFEQTLKEHSEFREKAAFPPGDMYTPESLVQLNHLRGPPAAA